jgi:hypothetical protein
MEIVVKKNDSSSHHIRRCFVDHDSRCSAAGQPRARDAWRLWEGNIMKLRPILLAGLVSTALSCSAAAQQENKLGNVSFPTS